MMHLFLRTRNLFFIFLLLSAPTVYGQRLLSRTISLNVSRQPVSVVLKLIEERADFYFSYNSSLIPGDSLVSLSVTNQPVRSVLNGLFPDRFQYREAGRHVIIQSGSAETRFVLTGQILDAETGEAASYVSVYDRQRLIATLTSEQGYFRLRATDRSRPIMLNISKVGYADTVITVRPDEDVRLSIRPRSILLDEVTVLPRADSLSWLSRLFISRDLRIQSRNLTRFLAAQPYQLAIVPGLGSHGRLSPQIVNRLSINLVGGYSAGVNGFEMGGVFNIVRKNVRGVQLGGAFNTVAGSVHGVQVAGLYNLVQDSLRGAQVSGLVGVVNRNGKGMQLSGLISIGNRNFHGMQLSGLANRTQGDLNGFQMAGLANQTRGRMHGVQLAGLYNTAGLLTGTQIGLINVADSSAGGRSIGLLNFIRNGKFTLSLSTSETIWSNVELRTGTRQFYTLLTVGGNWIPDWKAWQGGFGLGRDVRLGRRLDWVTEAVVHYLYLGNWQESHLLLRLHTGLQVSLSRRVGLSAGPALSMAHPETTVSEPGYLTSPERRYPGWSAGDFLRLWVGWQGGVHVSVR